MRRDTIMTGQSMVGPDGGLLGRLFFGGPRTSWRSKLSWLLEPSAMDVIFAVRSSLAAVLSLLIAMGMELDSPQWAPLTVWVVAQSSRGESLSKARWRIAGTVLGCCIGVALIAAFPQASALFFCCLAVWIGLCCGGATFLESYRAYGLVLTGFTSAIVATGAIAQPDEVFDIAIARGTYIILGVVCEALLAVLFMPTLQTQARKRLLDRLNGAFQTVRHVVSDLVSGRADAQTQGQVLTDLMAANARIEFDALEMGPRTHAADHAHAALAAMIMVLARARGMALLLEPKNEGAQADVPLPASLYADYDIARQHIEACAHPKRGDRFRFKMTSRRHALEAVENGIRSCAGILAGWLVWEVTGWPAGAGFISFVALVYGLLATRENPIVASTPFLKGALWCAFAAAIYAFWIMPAVTAPEVLIVMLMIVMTIGGLAARKPATAGYAFSFNMFLPVLIGPGNQSRFSEEAFFNNAMAFLVAVTFVGWTYRLVLPFRVDSHMRRTARWVERRLKALGAPGSRVTVHQWLAESASSLVRILRNAQGVPQPVRLAYMQTQFRAMTMGMHIVFLRDVAKDPVLPLSARRGIQVFLRKWVQTGTDATAWAGMTEGWLLRQMHGKPFEVQETLQKAAISLRILAAERAEDVLS
ncbi:FUSC family protein [Acetobacter cerevisiae]|uniref:FUSC family protein n=1 Tax=Acetobacter cerevisiae TaxID=178900 RepID=UPI00209FBB14|nr:FUSC family protein [Acetobacter cerevisiae]MCP1270388.1 FUSC family protein [Acetobacter cerevisiae]MCP1278341.1 FUSC family protein [Acetobacter cerevisiae]